MVGIRIKQLIIWKSEGHIILHFNKKLGYSFFRGV